MVGSHDRITMPIFCPSDKLKDAQIVKMALKIISTDLPFVCGELGVI